MGNVLSRLRLRDYLMQQKTDKSIKNKYKEIIYANFTDMRKRKVGDSYNIKCRRIIKRSGSERFLSSCDEEKNNYKITKTKSIDNISDLYSISPLSRHSSMRKSKSLDYLKDFVLTI
jgi:hypothetical protein